MDYDMLTTHPELDKKAATDKRVAKVRHDYPILLRRLQSTQEMITTLIGEGAMTPAEVSELENLRNYIKQEGVKQTRSDKAEIKRG